MKPDLVLDEDDKKKRFKKYKNSEEAVQSGGQNNEEPNVNSSYLRSSEAGNKNKRELGPAGVQATPKKKHQKKKSTNHEKSSSSPLGFPLPPFQNDLDDEDDESREEDFLEFVKETAGAMNVQKIFSDLAENESVIDPETGMQMNTGKLYNFVIKNSRLSGEK